MTDATADHGFLILHGWQNHRPPGHWQHWLAGRLTTLGHEVRYPQLPDADDPDLEVWLAELRTLLASMGGRRRTVVCHSLACALWLHAVAREDVAVPVDRVLLVAPPSAGFLGKYEEVAAFAPPPVSGGRLAAAAGSTRIVCGGDDPCCPEGAVAVFAGPLGLPADVIVAGAHLNSDSGYGPWPSVLEWCLDPSDGAPVRGVR
jgi:predicted alpha/beta hydrolase family esterase